MSTTLALDLDDATMGRLRVIGATRQQATIDLVREALADYLERQEGLAEDADRWRGYAETDSDLDHDALAGAALDRLGARSRSTVGAIAGPFGGRQGADADDLPHPDDDTARDAARRAFRALQQQQG